MLRTVGQWVQVDINTQRPKISVIMGSYWEHVLNVILTQDQYSTHPPSGHIIDSQMCDWNRYTWCLPEYPHGHLACGGSSIIVHKASMHL